MAIKLILSYTSQPLVNDSFGFAFFLNGLAIPINGFLGVNLNYWQLGLPNNTPFGIAILPTLSDTIDNTVAFLNSVYYHPNLTYTRVNNTIEVLMNIEGITFTKSLVSSSFTFEEGTIDIDEGFKAIYLIKYNDTENVPYEISISKKNFTGTVQTLGGKARLTKGSIDSHLDPIIGTSLELELEASLSLDLESLYSDDERTFRVVFKRNNTTIFIGFLKPDGVFQSFVNDYWIINLTCVDGLGFLSDLAFVKETGLQFVGLQSGKDILYNALKRTGLNLPLNTSLNIYYDGLTPSDTLDPLTQMYVSTTRFIKDDNDTIMNCKEVISSILKLFNASVTQYNGEWYVWRTNELAENAYLKFRRYDKNTGNYLGTKTLNLNFNIGSQINNKYPHHCNANQQISIRGSVSAYRLNYKYGFIKGTLKNPTLQHNGSLDYFDWTEYDMTYVINNPLDSTSLRVRTTELNDPNPIFKILGSSTVNVLQTDLVQLKIVMSSEYAGAQDTYAHFRVKQGNYYLTFDDTTLNPPQWVLITPSTEVTAFVISKFQTNSTYTLNIELPAFQNVGTLTVEVWSPRHDELLSNEQVFKLSNIDFVNLKENESGKIGEFHTALRKTRPSSIAKETETIFNGDSPSIVYEGAIFKADKVTPTSTWFRRGKIESYEILRICVEDVVRMQQKPAKIFTGDAYGYIPYFCLLTIDNVAGIFAFLEYSYDSYNNTTSFKALQVFNEELSDIDYKKTFNYGNTVKPTIQG